MALFSRARLCVCVIITIIWETSWLPEPRGTTRSRFNWKCLYCSGHSAWSSKAHFSSNTCLIVAVVVAVFIVHLFKQFLSSLLLCGWFIIIARAPSVICNCTTVCRFTFQLLYRHSPECVCTVFCACVILSDCHLRFQIFSLVPLRSSLERNWKHTWNAYKRNQRTLCEQHKASCVIHRAFKTTFTDTIYSTDYYYLFNNKRLTGRLPGELTTTTKCCSIEIEWTRRKNTTAR